MFAAGAGEAVCEDELEEGGEDEHLRDAEPRVQALPVRHLEGQFSFSLAVHGRMRGRNQLITLGRVASTLVDTVWRVRTVVIVRVT